MGDLIDAFKGVGTVGGTRQFQDQPYRHERYLKGNRYKHMSRTILVRKWLDGDDGFTISQYREWLLLAEEFLSIAEKRYSIKENKMLLVVAFDRWLRRN